MSLRRSMFAAALAAAVALPTGALAQRGPATTAAPAVAFGGGLGMEFGDVDGFGLRVDGVYPVQKLAPQATLGFVGSVGFTRFSEDLGGGYDLNINVLKLVPAARFGLALNPQLSLYGDAGL
ncbi:MAG TPA: porin family protein, partial [Anaeromyxobacteraceae bacterium]|nr:porin family protein [Anaeromyxobacteraceae bacterium]